MKPIIFSVLILFGGIQLSGCRLFYYSFSSKPRVSHSDLAKKYRKEGKTDLAVEEYQAHIQDRLAVKDRPESENPYFYYILIGDTYLEVDRLEDAKKSYLSAKEKDVDTALVVDRLRGLAKWYATRDRFEEATTILREHREIDPMMFDFDIDQYHKQAIDQEYHRASRKPAE